MKSNVVLLDRDGVINQDSLQYIKSPDEFIFLPKSIEAIVRLTEAGYKIGIATNQSGIARGYYSENVLDSIHEKMLYHIQKAGGEIAAIEYCMHLPEHTCLCRKPNAGMLLALAKRLDCDLNDVPFIGDKISDIQAAVLAGAKPIMVLSQMSDKSRLQSYPDVPIFDSLFQSVEYQLNG